MSTLLVIGLKNAILVIPLALIAFAVGRFSRRPALSHILWTIVLLKLLTPAVIHVPVGWSLGIESWLQSPAKVFSSSDSMRAADSGRRDSGVSRRKNDPKSIRGNSNESAHARHQNDSTINSRGSDSALAATAFAGNSRTLWGVKIEILVGIWLLGSLYLVSRIVWKSIQFHRYLRLAERRHESLGARAAELAARSGIGIAPRVIVVEGCLSPMLWGLGRRACLVFPVRLISRLSKAELDSLLLHELAHFARGDHWVRVLELVVGVVYWWHPVFWWARRELETAEEQCCDGWVVEHQKGARHTYAEALLSTIDFLHEPATVLPPVACGLGEVPFLKLRLTQIMRGQVAARLPNSITALVLFCGILCSPLEPALWAKSTGTVPQSINGPQSITGPQSISRRTRPQSFTGTLSGQSFETRRIDAPFSQSILSSAPMRSLGSSKMRSSFEVLPDANTNRASAQPGAWAVAHSPNGKHRIEARTGYQTTLTHSQPEFRLDLTAHRITCVSFAGDSQSFATGHEDSIVRRWDCDTGGVLRSYKGCDSPITSTHLSPDGKSLAAGTQTGEVVIWDVATGDEISHLRYPNIEVSCVRWSRLGDKLAIGIGGWSEHEQSRLIVRSIVEGVDLLEQFSPTPIGAFDWLNGDSAIMLVAWDGRGQVWNFNSSSIISEGHIGKDQVSAAAWCADCSLLDNWLEDATHFEFQE